MTAQGTWQSSDSNIASVSPSGVVTARAAGTATISATYQNVTGRLSVSVSIAPQIPNITGTWRGQYFICCGIASGDGVMTWTLTHGSNATSFSGTMTITGDFLLGGTTTGSIQGAWLADLRQFTFVVSVSPGGIPGFPGCGMTFNQSSLTYRSAGAPTNGGPYLDGGFYGNFCSSIPISLGSLQLVKQ